MSEPDLLIRYARECPRARLEAAIHQAFTSLNEPRASVDVLPFNFEASAMRFEPPSVNVPPPSSPVPVPAFRPVASTS